MQVCKYFESKHFRPTSYLAQTFSNQVFSIFALIFTQPCQIWLILSVRVLSFEQAPTNCDSKIMPRFFEGRKMRLKECCEIIPRIPKLHVEDNFFPKSFKKTNVGISLPRRRWNPGHNRGHFSTFSFFATMLVHKDPHSVGVIVIQLNLFCFLTEISAERKGLWTPKKIVQDTKVCFKLSEFLSSQSFHAQYFVFTDHDHEPKFMHEQFVPSSWVLSLTTENV